MGMPLVGHKTSKYTKHDGNDHFDYWIRMLFFIACGFGVFLGIPLGLAMLLTDALGLKLWIGIAIFFGIEISCLLCCVIGGMYTMVEAIVRRETRSSEEGEAYA